MIFSDGFGVRFDVFYAGTMIIATRRALVWSVREIAATLLHASWWMCDMQCPHEGLNGSLQHHYCHLR